MPTSATMKKSAGDSRRKQRIINPGFQWRFAGLLTLLVFAVSGFLSTVLYGVLYQQARARALALLQQTEPPSMLSDAAMLIGSALAFSTVAAVAVGVWSLVFSHRICGPIFVLTRWLEELGTGRFPNVRPLRKKDEFKPIHDVFQQTVASLKARKRTQLDNLTRAFALAQEAAAADSESSQVVLEKLTAELAALHRDAAEALGEPPTESVDALARVAGSAPEQPPVLAEVSG